MKWGDNRTLKFMRLYRSHPCLWDSASPHYNVRKKRDDALNAIIAAMNMPNFTQAACKAKIKNIRSQYCHELRRIRQALRGGGKVRKPTLAWFDTVDSFLRPIVIQRTKNIIKSHEKHPHLEQAENSSDNMVDLEFIDYSKNNLDDTSNDERVMKTEDLDVSDVESEELYEDTAGSGAASRHAEPAPPYCSKYETDSDEPRKQGGSLKHLTTTINKLENAVGQYVAASAAAAGNEFDVFGQSVAAQLNNMPLDDALQLQADIQHLITTKRIDCLNRIQESRR